MSAGLPPFHRSSALDRDTAQELQNVVCDLDLLMIWTVYSSPRDFPGKFVARPFLAVKHRSRPLPVHLIADSLKGVREKIPVGTVLLARQPSDDAAIVETWV
jgi:hypothetical protein